jgi:hypothetical protein
VEKLRVPLVGDGPLIKRQTGSLEAYNLFLRGRHGIHRLTLESLAKGKEYLEQAIALDANYALAYTGMAEYYWASAYTCDPTDGRGQIEVHRCALFPSAALGAPNSGGDQPCVCAASGAGPCPFHAMEVLMAQPHSKVH